MAIPAPAPFTCARCNHPSSSHYKDGGCCQAGDGLGRWCECPNADPPMLPEPHEIATASAVTEWTCPFCQHHQDVWGEGAMHTWMECGSCGKYAFLDDAEEG